MPPTKYKHVSVWSRHDNDNEMAELLAFVKEADEKGLLNLLEAVSYDSVSCICHITPKPAHSDILSVDRHPVMNVAMNHISQFEWAGDIKHSPQKEMEEHEASRTPIERLVSEFDDEVGLGGILPSQMSFKDLLTKARMNTETVDHELTVAQTNRLQEIYDKAVQREIQNRRK